MTERLLIGAAAIGRHFGWTAHQVYKLIETKPDFPAFRLGDGPRARLYARPEDIEEWIAERARRSLEARLSKTLH